MLLLGAIDMDHVIAAATAIQREHESETSDLSLIRALGEAFGRLEPGQWIASAASPGAASSRSAAHSAAAAVSSGDTSSRERDPRVHPQANVQGTSHASPDPGSRAGYESIRGDPPAPRAPTEQAQLLRLELVEAIADVLPEGCTGEDHSRR